MEQIQQQSGAVHHTDEGGERLEFPAELGKGSLWGRQIRTGFKRKIARRKKKARKGKFLTGCGRADLASLSYKRALSFHEPSRE
jgi:hypothetical protein